MTVIFEEFRRNIKGNLLVDLLLLVQFALCFYLVIFFISYYIDMNEVSDDYIRHMDKNYYQVQLSEFLSISEDDDILWKAEVGIDFLKNNDKFYYMNAMPDALVNFMEEDLYSHVDSENVKKFEQGTDPSGAYQDGIKWGPALYTYSVDYKAQQFHDFQLDCGRLFYQEEFSHMNREQVVPIILGYEYKEFFELEEEFRIRWDLIEFNCKVIGFLAKDTNATIIDPLYLDRYILFPLMEFSYYPETADEMDNHLWNYFRLFTGWVVTDVDVSQNKLAHEFSDFTLTYGLPLMAGSIHTSGTVVFADEITDTVNLITILLIVMFIFVIISFIITIINKVEKNMSVYAIHLMNGGSILMIFYAILFEILFVLFIAGGVAIAWHRRGILSNPDVLKRYLLILLGFIAVTIFFVILMLLKKIKGINIEELMREK